MSYRGDILYERCIWNLLNKKKSQSYFNTLLRKSSLPGSRVSSCVINLLIRLALLPSSGLIKADDSHHPILLFRVCCSVLYVLIGSLYFAYC
jgi:hypothetical protein